MTDILFGLSIILLALVVLNGLKEMRTLRRQMIDLCKIQKSDAEAVAEMIALAGKMRTAIDAAREFRHNVLVITRRLEERVGMLEAGAGGDLAIAASIAAEMPDLVKAALAAKEVEPTPEESLAEQHKDLPGGST